MAKKKRKAKKKQSQKTKLLVCLIKYNEIFVAKLRKNLEFNTFAMFTIFE